MSKAQQRLEKILECIENIDFILSNNGLNVTQSIEDRIIKQLLE